MAVSKTKKGAKKRGGSRPKAASKVSASAAAVSASAAAAPPVCFDDPPGILEKKFCVSPLSKNFKGQFDLSSSKQQLCNQPKCQTLKTVNKVVLSLGSNTCDSQIGKLLGGGITVTLITAYDQDGLHRGFHAGDFTWNVSGTTKVIGRMSGVTNEGSHRLPIKDCQKCDEIDILEGRLCGQVVDTQNPSLKGCQVMAVYRLKFKATKDGGKGPAWGVIEGVVICRCD